MKNKLNIVSVFRIESFWETNAVPYAMVFHLVFKQNKIEQPFIEETAQILIVLQFSRLNFLLSIYFNIWNWCEKENSWKFTNLDLDFE